MSFVQHDHMIQTIPAYRADNSFAVRILPRRPCCNQDFFDAHVRDPLREVVTIGTVAISQKKTRGFFVRKGVDDLLGGPFGVGMAGHIEVDDLSPVMAEHDEYVQNAEGDRRNGEKIAGNDVGSVIGKERSPRLRGRFPRADHILGHGPFSNVVTLSFPKNSSEGKAEDQRA